LLENFSEGKIDVQIEHSISEKLFPGAVVLAAIDGKIFYHKAFGRSGFGASNYFIQKNDVFSIGKLTSLYTIACALKLIDGKKMSAENELEYFFDEISESGMSRMAISDLMLHRSGIGKKLTNLKSYWTRNDLIVNIFREYIPNRIGNQPEFSSLNMILLQDVIEKVSGEKLPKYFEENIREPLNISKSGYSYTIKDSGQFYYNPSHSVTFAASTQDDLIKTILERETEGSSGFDGFSTNASELAIFLQMMLQKGYYDHIQILNAETVDSWINGFSNDLTSNNRIYELIDPGGCFINLNFDKNYFIIALTNAGIKNINNSSFNDFSKKIIKIFEEEISRNIL
jgi:CubicO group peptidase (beta-lactamase class C family)